MTREEALSALQDREPFLILAVVNGSQAQGTALSDSSDFDLMGVAVPPVEHYFGLSSYGSDGTKEVREGDLDAVIYEARKMIRLLCGANPNTMCAIHTRPEDVLFTTPAGDLLRANRDMFVTKKVATTFMGYATSALKKMGAPNGPTGDMGKKRKANVEQFGYDQKDASCLVRLLRLGEEILRTGEVNVCRTGIDAEEIKSIKRGEWSLERVQSEAAEGFERMRAAEAMTELPLEVDREAANRLCVEVVRMSLNL